MDVIQTVSLRCYVVGIFPFSSHQFHNVQSALTRGWDENGCHISNTEVPATSLFLIFRHAETNYTSNGSQTGAALYGFSAKVRK
jgi:hypothetical protein